jgi:hypothetical protein
MDGKIWSFGFSAEVKSQKLDWAKAKDLRPILCSLRLLDFVIVVVMAFGWQPGFYPSLFAF